MKRERERETRYYEQDPDVWISFTVVTDLEE